jgi:putative FmdB family regulatory protein
VRVAESRERVPLHEYECQSCGHRFERIQKFNSRTLRKCPACKKGKVKKLLSAPAVQFKGTGWYITDYQRKGTSSTLPDRGEGTKEKGEKEAGKGEGGKEKAEKETGKKETAKDTTTGGSGSAKKTDKKD